MLPEGKEGPWRKERPYSALVPGHRRTGCPSAAHRLCPRLILPHSRKRKPAEAHQEPLGIHGGQGTDPPAQAPSPGHVMGSRALSQDTRGTGFLPAGCRRPGRQKDLETWAGVRGLRPGRGRKQICMGPSPWEAGRDKGVVGSQASAGSGAGALGCLHHGLGSAPPHPPHSGRR